MEYVKSFIMPLPHNNDSEINKEIEKGASVKSIVNNIFIDDNRHFLHTTVVFVKEV